MVVGVGVCVLVGVGVCVGVGVGVCINSLVIQLGDCAAPEIPGTPATVCTNVAAKVVELIDHTWRVVPCTTYNVVPTMYIPQALVNGNWLEFQIVPSLKNSPIKLLTPFEYVTK